MFSGLQCFEDSSFIHPYLNTHNIMINCTKFTSPYLVFHVREVDGPEQRHNVDVCNSKMGGNEIEVNHLENRAMDYYPRNNYIDFHAMNVLRHYRSNNHEVQA